MSNERGCQCGQAHGACTTEFQYAVKLVCGEVKPAPNTPETVVAPGHYWTAINIHNPDKCNDAHFRWKVAVANQIDQEQGSISPFQRPHILGPDAAIEIDCKHAMQVFPPPPQAFLKGYVVIESDIELDVVAVYTGAQGVSGPLTTFHTERVQPRCVPVCEDLVLPLHTGVAPWQTVQPTVGPVAILSPNPGWTAPLPAGAQWVSQTSTDSTDATSTAGGPPRSYELCFNLCSGFAVPAPLVIQVLADDTATVFLNGGPSGGLGPVPWNTLTSLTVPSNLLRAGRNCFRVDVTNITVTPPQKNPTGFALAGILRVAKGKCPCSP